MTNDEKAPAPTKIFTKAGCGHGPHVINVRLAGIGGKWRRSFMVHLIALAIPLQRQAFLALAFIPLSSFNQCNGRLEKGGANPLTLQLWPKPVEF